MASKKSLTEPPTNLKEAIDWVIQIKGHTQELGKALDALLNHDGSEVAMKVLENYRHVSESVIEKLEDANKGIFEQKDRFHFTYTALNNLSQGLKPFDPQSDANISPDYVEKVGKWASSVNADTFKQPIKAFAEGLKTFVGSSGSGILQNSSATAYSNLGWNTLTDSDKRDCAAILLGIMPVVYIGLTYLYWQCAGTGGWDKESLSGSGSDQGSLKQYMEALGYSSNLKSQNGGTIVSSVMKNMFSGEFNKAYTAAQPQPPPSTSPSYPDFLSELQKQANQSQLPNTTSPLTSLYLISHYYITNFIYTVETSSPATPSFLGYLGTAALGGGAYGLNTGGLGTFVSALLA